MQHASMSMNMYMDIDIYAYVGKYMRVCIEQQRKEQEHMFVCFLVLPFAVLLAICS